MKAVFNRQKLAEAFATAARFAPGRSPQAVLQNVKLTVAESGSTLQATNTEVGVRIDFDGVDIEQLGSALLPVATVAAMFRECRDSELRINATKNKVTISGERTTVNLAATDPDEFADVALFDADSYYVLPAALLKASLSRTLSAAGESSSRYVLGGVKVEFAKDAMAVASTDGRRAIAMEGPATTAGKPSVSEAIIPHESAKRIASAIDGLGDVEVAMRNNDVLLRAGSVTLYARLLEGRFPAWRDHFGKRADESNIEVPAGQLASLLRIASIVSNQETNGVDLTFADGVLSASLAVQGVGDSQSEIAIAYDGEKLIVRLDYHFVLDFLGPLPAEQIVTVRAVSEEASVVFEADGGAFKTVIMPMSRR